MKTGKEAKKAILSQFPFPSPVLLHTFIIMTPFRFHNSSPSAQTSPPPPHFGGGFDGGGEKNR